MSYKEQGMGGQLLELEFQHPNIASMPSSSLISLPSDLLLDVLFSLSSYKDLYSLISTTTRFYDAFNLYPNRILTQVSKNMLRDCWEDAMTILVWQRHFSHTGGKANYDALNKDLEERFILQKKDIPTLLSNHRFFERCKNYSPSGSLSTLSNNHLFPSRTPGGALTMKNFYQMWLLHLRFKYEEIETFASRAPFTREHYQDLRAVSDIIFCNLEHCDNFGISPLPCSYQYTQEPENLLYGTLFSIWRPLAENAPTNIINDNPLLYLKIVCHIASWVVGGKIVTTPRGNEGRWMRPEVHYFRVRFDQVMNRFRLDYVNMSVSDIVRDYRISFEGLRERSLESGNL